MIPMLLHAVQRASQRGYLPSDNELILLLGREVEGGLLVLQKDADHMARELERQAARVRQLANTRIVFDGGAAKTIYRAHPKKQRNLLRRAACRDLEGK